ncbi:hypothetical protein BH11PSE10_BH11PSE10_00260 [soil metagenome]
MKTFCKAMLALAALVLTAGAVQASPVNYTFSGVIEDTNGAPTLVGEVFSGTFSFDDALLTNSTDFLDLTGLTVSFLGVSYTLADAAPGSAVDFFAGQVTGIDAYFAAANQLTLTNGFGSPYLNYISAAGVESNGSLTVTAVPVPEPAALALSLAGLGAAGFATMRRRRPAAVVV